MKPVDLALGKPVALIGDLITGHARITKNFVCIDPWIFVIEQLDVVIDNPTIVNWDVFGSCFSRPIHTKRVLR